MPLPVGDVGDEALGLAELAADQAHDVDVAHLVVAADVVHLADAPVRDHEVDGLAVVGDIQPVAHVQSLPVDRQRAVGEGAHDHERDELFRKLIRPVVIRAARDRDRQAVGASVCAHEQVGRRLGAAVGRARVQRRLLGEQQVRPVERQVAVDLVGRDLMEADIPVFAAGVHEHGRADDVRLQKQRRVGDRAIHMALGREVHDHVGVLLGKEAVDRLTVADVRLDKAEIRLPEQRRERGEIAGIGELVDAHEPVVRIALAQVKQEIRADEAGAAGYESSHAVPSQTRAYPPRPRADAHRRARFDTARRQPAAAPS